MRASWKRPAGPIAFCILTTNNKDQSWTNDNEGDLFCAEIGSAIYQFFNARRCRAVAPVAGHLQMGADGELVQSLQRTLNARITPAPGIGMDGDFGPETEKAVKKFQTQAGLEATGIVSADTWKALGPLIMEEQPAPEPAVVNAEPSKKQPADALDGPPFVTCKAWAIIDGNSGEFLAGDQHDEKRDPASTTKIMTAYLVTSLAEKEPSVLDEVITFSERADKTSGFDVRRESRRKAAGRRAAVRPDAALRQRRGRVARRTLWRALRREKQAEAKSRWRRPAERQCGCFRQLYRRDESQGCGDRHEVDPLQQSARPAERRASDDGPRPGPAGARGVQAPGVQQACLDAAARSTRSIR